MTIIFVIDDEAHAELQAEFSSFEEAVAELRRRAEIPWNEPPNVAPCMNWRNCGRRYEIVEYNTVERPWRKLSCTPVLEISAAGVQWSTQGPARHR
jgi:hypothetical protein